MNMIRVKRIALALAAVFLLAQFVQPKRTNPPVVPSRSLEAHVQVPQDVLPILKRACGDCHSSETVWPWYSHVAPLSWLVADDVNTGRSHVNFQDWEAQENPKEAAEHLALICKLAAHVPDDAQRIPAPGQRNRHDLFLVTIVRPGPRGG